MNKAHILDRKQRKAFKAGQAILLIIALVVNILPVSFFAQPAYAAGGDFANTDFAAAAPYTYDHATGGGAYNDRTVGDYNDITEQLEGAQFACNDVVSYLTLVEVKSSPVDPVQVIELDFSFLADSTGQSGAATAEVIGVRINYGSVENGGGGGIGTYDLDTGMSDDGGSTAILVSQSLTGPLFEAGSELEATVRIDDLEAGEKVVLRIDTRLACEPGSSPTGNLQGQLSDGRVINPALDTINTGEQTIPFLRIGDIAGAGEPLVFLTKSVTTEYGACGVDDVKELAVTQGDTVKYCYEISNPGTADLFDVELIDDNGTEPTSDDFVVSLTGLEDLDGDADLGDLASGQTIYSEALVTMNIGDTTIINLATVSGNNNLSGGNYAILTDEDIASVSVEGLPNQPPIAHDDSFSGDEDTVINGNVLPNDNDPDGNLDTDSVSLASSPSNGTLILNSDGSFSYTPDENFHGIDSFTYEVCDLDGLCDQATVTLTINAVNDVPVAADDSYSTAEDTPLSVPAPGVLDNDSDVDGDALTVVDYTQPANGSVTQNPDGSFTYTPNENFNGVDTFEYTISDGNGGTDTATITITVSGVNDAPDAADDSAIVDEDGSVDILVLGNDSDPDGDELSVTEVSDPANGTTVINPDGTITYTPDANFCGQDSFTYTIIDGNGGSDTATVTVDVACVNDAPIANDDTASTDEDVPVDIPVLDNDSDIDGDELTVSSVSDPANGTATINEDGTVTYTPDPDYNGEDSFTYTVCDADGLCDAATVTVTIGALNDPPVANDDSASTPEDTPVLIDATANDYDVDGNLVVSTATVLSDPANGTVINNSNGTFTYTPNENFNGTDSFTYEVCDSDGLCDSATVVIDITPVNDAPVANDDSYNATEDTPLTIEAPSILGNDSDVDGDDLSVSDYTQPGNGTLEQNPDGSFTYTPDENFCGQDSFSYTISDGNGGSDTATVTIEVACVNDAPVAVDDAYSTDADTILNVSATGILGNDSDVDGDELTVSSVNGDAANFGQQITLESGALLTVYADGSYSFDPNGQYDHLGVGQTAEESYSYTISDGNGGSDTATVTITINGVNDSPVAVDDAYTAQQDQTLSISAEEGLLPNDYDVDGDALFVDSYDAVSQFGGSVAVNSDGSFEYTPAPGFAGYDTFTYTISDGNGGYDTATVTITVEARNNRSIAVDLQDWTLSGSSLSGYLVITNQSDGYDVQITDLDIKVQYRTKGSGGWTYVAVEGCSFDPMTNFLVVDQQGLNFSGCELAEDIPDDATIRVTAEVKIFGRFMGKGKADGWFLDRLSK
jgi:VCBS repeat-containing protein